VHAVAVVQDTPSMALCVPPGGTGTAMTRQEVPFHASARAEVPELSLAEPTATHQAGPAHESAANVPFATRAFGVRCTDHFAPVAAVTAARAGAPGTATCAASSAAAATRTTAPGQRACRRPGDRKRTTAAHPVS
jgi:hypothetical protein